MTKNSKINEAIQIIAWLILVLTVLGAIAIGANAVFNPLLNVVIVLFIGTMSSSFLFISSEVLTRLQQIEYNTRKTESDQTFLLASTEEDKGEKAICDLLFVYQCTSIISC